MGDCRFGYLIRVGAHTVRLFFLVKLGNKFHNNRRVEMAEFRQKLFAFFVVLIVLAIKGPVHLIGHAVSLLLGHRTTLTRG